MCSKLTPRARIPDTRIPQFMQPCLWIYTSLIFSLFHSKYHFSTLFQVFLIMSFTFPWFFQLKFQIDCLWHLKRRRQCIASHTFSTCNLLSQINNASANGSQALGFRKAQFPFHNKGAIWPGSWEEEFSNLVDLLVTSITYSGGEDVLLLFWLDNIYLWDFIRLVINSKK